MSRADIDVIVIGELNIDLVLWNVPMPENEKEKLAQDMRFAMGSSSAITAHNLAAIGSKVAFIGKAGSDAFGDFIIQQLQAGGVNTTPIIRDNSLKTGATIVLANPPKKAMLTYMGAMTELTIADINWEVISKSKHLHVGSFFLQTGIRKDIPQIFSKAKELGLSTSMDTNWDPDEKWGEDLFAALKFTDIFLPNDEESLQITRKPTIEQAIKELSQLVQVLAVKRGKSGATLCSNGQTFNAAGFKVTALETTGAGDSFNAGFLHKYLQGANWQECLNFGNACGALAVTAMGGTEAFRDKVNLKTKLSGILESA
jgi:sugar/nucleoside kinase (ribokinase family)